jgi:hypothetical protein
MYIYKCIYIVHTHTHTHTQAHTLMLLYIYSCQLHAQALILQAKNHTCLDYLNLLMQKMKTFLYFTGEFGGTGFDVAAPG